MKRDLTKKFLLAALAAVFCLSCTACSTSAGTNAKSYFSNLSSIVKNLTTSSTPPSSTNSGDGQTVQGQGTPLDAVSGFTVDADGNYSFAGVENASFYLIYFCDTTATEDGDDYLYASSPINETGAAQYTGNCNELFDFAYGEYLVKAFAFPDMTDSTYQMSTAATANYTKTGAQDAPIIDYFWNTNDSTLELVLTNVEAYTYQAYPEKVDVTFSNVEDASDTVTVSITDINADSYSVVADALSKGSTYSITAVSNAGSGFVTNAVSDVTAVSDGVLFGDINVLSDQYSYSDGWATFPRLVESFDLNAGGACGQVSRGFGAAFVDAVMTPVAANSGSDWSYTMLVDFGVISMTGTLELKSDGTAAMYEGGGPVAAGTVYGSWVDNGDGTAMISYSPAEISS